MQSPRQEIRANVFVSCGQATEAERSTARHVRDVLMHLGFNVYLAIREQSLNGVIGNVFGRLQDSDYVIFIDFARNPEAVEKRRKKQCFWSHKKQYFWSRSVFTHQELAAAKAYDLDILAFHQEPEWREGMASAMHLNWTLFSRESQVADLVRDAVAEKLASGQWSLTTRRRLDIQLRDEDISVHGDRTFLHLRVLNCDHRRTAKNCLAVMQLLRGPSIQEMSPGHPKRQFELRWEGFERTPSMHLLPGTARTFDVCDYVTAQPLHEFNWGVVSDSATMRPRAPIAGDYEIKINVISDNFPDGTITVVLNVPQAGEPQLRELADTK